MDAKDVTKVSVLNVWKDLRWKMVNVCDVIYLIQNHKNINLSKIDAHSAKMEQKISVAIVVKVLLIFQILQIKINKSILSIQVLIQQIKKLKSAN
jgi:hypothetical protein